MKKVLYLAVTTATVMLAACGGKVSHVGNDGDSIACDTIVEEAVVDSAAIKDSIRHTVGYIKQRIDSLYKHRSDRYGCSEEYNRLNNIADSICEAQGGVWVDGDHWINGQDKDENWWYKVKKVTVGKDGNTAIAEVLDFDVDYFFRPFTVNIDFNSFEFRKRSSLSSKKEAAIKERIALSVEKYVEIETITHDSPRFDLNYDDISLGSDNDARSLGARFRLDLNLGIDCISTPIEVLETNGVKVIEIDTDPKFDGSCVRNLGLPVIVLNKNLTSERRRLTLFHELAHLILAFEEGADVERLCNVFANEVLLPSAVLKSLLGEHRKNLSWKELKLIQEGFGISVEAIMVKAKQIGIISESTHRSLCIDLNRNAELKRRVQESAYPKEVSSRFERLVFRALADNIITISKAASLLDRSVDEVNAQITLA